MFPLCGKKFQLARIGLMRAGCPTELTDLEGNIRPAHIVVVKNTAKFGTIAATGYAPRAVIVAGALTRSRLTEGGVSKAWAYVEDGAMEHDSRDVMSCAELMTSLARSIQASCYVNAECPVTGQAWPFIEAIYPFRDYCEYAFNGRRYRQSYAINATRSVLICGGSAIAVQGKFVAAASDGVVYPDAGIHTGNAKESMQRVQTGIRYASAPARAQLQSFSTGGTTSELVTQILRNWTNIVEAASAYVEYIKSHDNKKPMRPAFYPVGLTDDGKIKQAIVANGIDAFDFALWSAEAKTKRSRRVSNA